MVDLCQKNVLGRVTRRLHENEKRSIRDGSVFVYEENESKIKRWTDGKIWSPSRCNGIFLCYREYKPKGKFRDIDENEMFKKTLTAKFGEKTYHIITYANLEDEMNGTCCFKYGNRLKMIHEQFFGINNKNIKEWTRKLNYKNKMSKECEKNIKDESFNILNEEIEDQNENNNIFCNSNLKNYENFDIKSEEVNDIFDNCNNYADPKNLFEIPAKINLCKQKEIFNENYFKRRNFSFDNLEHLNYETKENYAEEFANFQNQGKITNQKAKTFDNLRVNRESLSEDNMYDDIDIYLDNPYNYNNFKSSR
ncbi:hypothetical protein GVAV_001332 [Gurleya vavrai]